MHFTKISALVALASFVLASPHPEITEAPMNRRAWQDDLNAGLSQASAAISQARIVAANFMAGINANGGGHNNHNTNNKRGDDSKYLYPVPSNGHYYTKNHEAPAPTPAPMNDPTHWESVAADWEAYGSSVAASAKSRYGTPYTHDWEAYGASIASSASAHWVDGYSHGEYGEHGYHGEFRPRPTLEAEDTGCVHDDNDDEYVVPAATGTFETGWPTATPNMVQVNVAAARVEGARYWDVLGAGAAVLAVAAGMV